MRRRRKKLPALAIFILLMGMLCRSAWAEEPILLTAEREEETQISPRGEGLLAEDPQNPLYRKYCKVSEETDLSERGKTVPLLVVLLNFEDRKIQRSPSEWSEAIFGEKGVGQYFLENSAGNFTFTPAIVEGQEAEGVLEVTLPIEMPVYRTEENPWGGHLEGGVYKGTDGKNYSVLKEDYYYAYAMNALDEAYESLDFSAYDKNKDTILDQNELAVLLIAAGDDLATSISGDVEGKKGVWSTQHIFTQQDEEGTAWQLCLDRTGISDFALTGELGFIWNTEKEENERTYTQIGTVCHELAHAQGAADLYDTIQMGLIGVGDVSLMASGAYTFTEESPLQGSVPTHLDPVNKVMMEFFEPQLVGQSGEYTLYPAADERYNILQIDIGNTSYLIENRSYQGFDRGLEDCGGKGEGGIVIWRIEWEEFGERWAENRVNSDESRAVLPVYAGSWEKGTSVRFWSNPYLKRYKEEKLCNEEFSDIIFPMEENGYRMILQEDEDGMIALDLNRSYDEEKAMTIGIFMEKPTEQPQWDEDIFYIEGERKEEPCTVSVTNAEAYEGQDVRWRVYRDLLSKTEEKDIQVSFDEEKGELTLKGKDGLLCGNYWVTAQVGGMEESFPQKISVWKDKIFFTVDPLTVDFGTIEEGEEAEKRQIIFTNTGGIPFQRELIVGEGPQEERWFLGLLTGGETLAYGDQTRLELEAYTDLEPGTYETEIHIIGHGEAPDGTAISDSQDVTVRLEVRPRGFDGEDSGGHSHKEEKPTRDSMTQKAVFTDVAADAWSAGAIGYLADRGLLFGMGDGSFRPGQAVSRAEFITLLRAASCFWGIPADGGSVAPFKDVAADAWYAEGVSWAVEQGLAHGIGEGLFAPEEKMTRQDMAFCLWNALRKWDLQLPAKKEEIAFSDAAEIAPYAREAVTGLVQAGILNGMGDGSFAPEEQATREQMAILVAHLVQILEQTE